jgi:membrane-bound lytic murein transglycosylase F
MPHPYLKIALELGTDLTERTRFSILTAMHTADSPADAPHPLAPRDPEPTPLPLALHNWRVLEIEGEATLVAAAPTPEVNCPLLIEDHPDDWIIAHLKVRQLVVAAGETAIFDLALHNNGSSHACFEIRVEGWLDEQWVKITPGVSVLADTEHTHIWLPPTERATVVIAITPPRSARSAAGEHALAVVVRASQYPHRFHRLGACLRVEPYTALALGDLHPRQLTTSWRRPSARLRLPIVNHSNHPAEVYVHGHAANQQCQITFQVPNPPQTKTGRVTLELAAGATATLLVHARPRRRPLIGLRPQSTVLSFAAGIVGAQRPPTTANVRVLTRPLFGPKHLLGVMTLGLIGLIGSVIVGATTALVTFWSPSAPPALTNQIAANPPVVAIVVNLAQPAATAVPAVATVSATAQPAAPMVEAAPRAQPDPAVPIVQLAQISAPGAPAPDPIAYPSPPLQPPPAIRQQRPTTAMTYRQLFQEVAISYDLNWRMLAAQAYVESGFDALALGNSGALGLMQIMPATWREWSPTVDVSDPFDAYSSVLVAAIYLDFLRKELGELGHPQQEWMLVAYNWGVDHLTDHLQAGLGWDELPTSTRQYAQDVLRIAETIPPE